MIAYVFWHWKKPAVSEVEYEKRQRDFHAALAASPPAGFVRSFSACLVGAPWTKGEAAYEDWYLVEDFGALASLNEGAVSGSRSAPHDSAAAVAEDGTAGIYALSEGQEHPSPGQGLWFGKPAGMRYSELFELVSPLVDAARGALWMRQMVLGPGMEFCLHAERPVSLPGAFKILSLPLRRVW